MPPSPEKQITDPDHLLPPHKKSSGPVFGTIIILALLIAGALYFWIGEIKQSTQQVPYIPNGTTTLPAIPAGD